MKAKFGSIITAGTGSLSGHTIQHSHGGVQLRTKPIPRGLPSAEQYTIRSINPVLQAGWRALTNTQRKIWNDWPVTHGVFNAKGDPHPLSGHSLWMKYQYIRLFKGYPFYTSPLYYNPDGLFSESISNGTFNSSLKWTTGIGWSISAGVLNWGNTGYNGTSTYQIASNMLIPIELNSTYQLQFTINIAAGKFAWIYFLNSNGSVVFAPKYKYPAGLNTFIVKIFSNFGVNGIGIFGYYLDPSLNGAPYSLDNLSIKKIY